MFTTSNGHELYTIQGSADTHIVLRNDTDWFAMRDHVKTNYTSHNTNLFFAPTSYPCLALVVEVTKENAVYPFYLYVSGIEEFAKIIKDKPTPEGDSLT